MEENIAQIQSKKTTSKLTSFIIAFCLAVVFCIICIPFLVNANDLTFTEKASIGQINLWRIVIIFGVLSIITTIYSVIKKKDNKLVVIFLWMFWILGTVLAVLISNKGGGIHLSPDILKAPISGIEANIVDLILILPWIVWFFGIYYCRKVAIRFNMSSRNAILAGTFLPVLSILIYFFYSYLKNTKEGRVKIIKITAGSVIALVLISAGTVYYIIGTPEYSLYKLKRAIISNNGDEFLKYFDTKNIAEKYNESPSGFQEAWIASMNASFWEIKEENPDKSKDAIAFISTGLTGNMLDRASVSYTENSDPLILLKLNAEGAKLFADVTNRNVGKQIGLFLGNQLFSSPTVKNEIDNGEITLSSNFNYSQDQIISFVKRINDEKSGMISGLKIKDKTVNGNSAKIIIGIIGDGGTGTNAELSMVKMKGTYWKIVQIGASTGLSGTKLPAPEGDKAVTFSWKYKGKNYSLDEKLYDSYYKFYNSLPAQDVFNGESLVGKLEKDNELFIKEFEGDKTIGELAQSIKLLREKNNLNENQLVELVSTFVQTIPYDTEKFNNRKAGLNGSTEKPTYPYEVLYDNKGVCQDKSYLAYVLLKEMGYGVSLFLFPDPADNHMAIGVKCPVEYSNYDSGYCFLETTSLGNKIGSPPNLSKEFGTATSKIELSDFSNDSTESGYSPLGKIEILNKTDGLAYTGVIDTFNTQKEIDNLFYAIRKMDGELNASRKDLDNQDEKIGNIVDKLDRLAKSSKNGSMSAYNDYNDLYPSYKKAVSNFEKDRKAFNAKIATRNQLNSRYNSLIRNFYL